jgi:hypothetical protein
MQERADQVFPLGKRRGSAPSALAAPEQPDPSNVSMALLPAGQKNRPVKPMITAAPIKKTTIASRLQT